jgi:hypothetical protein
LLALPALAVAPSFGFQLRVGGSLSMMQWTDMPMGMMWGMGFFWLLVIVFLLLGIAAFIKYLRS